MQRVAFFHQAAPRQLAERKPALGPWRKPRKPGPSHLEFADALWTRGRSGSGCACSRRTCATSCSGGACGRARNHWPGFPVSAPSSRVGRRRYDRQGGCEPPRSIPQPARRWDESLGDAGQARRATIASILIAICNALRRAKPTSSPVDLVEAAAGYLKMSKILVSDSRTSVFRRRPCVRGIARTRRHIARCRVGSARRLA